jgi:hypothetical protein
LGSPFWVCFWMVVCARLRPVIHRLMGCRLVTAEVDRPEVAKNNEELPYLGAIFLWIGATPFLVGLVCFTGVVSLKQCRGMWQDIALIDS